MKKNFIILLIFFILIYCNKLIALEITLNLYDPLSKTFSNSMPGTVESVIDRKTIESNINLPIHKIIDKISGIKTRSIYGNNSSGSKTTIDIRGMGAQAKSNVLILVNGQRLNNIDMSEIDFPGIPINSIDKIEILKGNSASVLYGDGAIGGAINFITNKEFDKLNKNEIKFKTGSFNSRETSFNSINNFNNYSLSTYFINSTTDGYRDENEQLQNNFTSEIRYKGNLADHFYSFNFNEQVMSTPSDRSQIQLYSDRRGSDTPDDYINSLGASFMYGTNYQFNSNSTFVLSSSMRLKDSYSDLQSTSYPSYNDTSLTNYQLSPRINQSKSYFGKFVFSTYGVDLQYADYESFRKKNENAIPLHIYNAWQSNQSVFTNQSFDLSKKTTIGIGLRYQRNIIGIGDKLNTNAPDYSGWQTEHSIFKDEEYNYSSNLGIDYNYNQYLSFFGRIGNGYRYPNIDDRIGGSGDTSFSLKTQKSFDIELGSKITKKKSSYVLSSYIIESENELGYDSDNFVNININSTKRFGIEFETNNFISKNISLNNNIDFSKAKYTSGNQGTYANDFKDRDVPLVPQFSLNSNLEWQLSKFTKVSTTLEFQDDMRMESDDENFQHKKIPSHFLSNLSLESTIANLNFIFSIDNIFNESFYNYAVASSSSQGVYNAYPEPGRVIHLSVGKNF